MQLFMNFYLQVGLTILILKSFNILILKEVQYELAEIEFKKKFIEYHKEKVNFRIVKKDRNLGRSHQTRIGRQKKDLTIE